MANDQSPLQRASSREEKADEESNSEGSGDQSSTDGGPRATDSESSSEHHSEGSAGANQWWNRTRYQLYAPVYDWIAKPWKAGRERAIDRLDLEPGERILILGSGTGSDLPYLPKGVEVAAIDLSPAMVQRTAGRAERLGLDVDARVGDAQSLPFENDRFDAVILHLVISVVPNPERLVQEAARVLDVNGRVSIYDKFVPAGEQPSLPRRLANPVARVLFADLNRSLEPMLSRTGLQLEEREPFLGGLYTVTVARQSMSD